jgi:hypothetical protein
MVGASPAAEKDYTTSEGMMALSRVLFEFRGTLPCTKVKANPADSVLTTYHVFKVRVFLEYLLGCVLGCIS